MFLFFEPCSTFFFNNFEPFLHLLTSFPFLPLYLFTFLLFTFLVFCFFPFFLFFTSSPFDMFLLCFSLPFLFFIFQIVFDLLFSIVLVSPFGNFFFDEPLFYL